MAQSSNTSILQSSNPGVRCIAFDAVGTLIAPDPPVRAVYCAVGRRHGSRLSEDEVARRFRAAFQQSEETDVAGPDDWDRPDRLRTSEEFERRRWQAIVRGVFDDVVAWGPCFDELFEHFARPQAWICCPGVGETLRELKARGFELAVASNFDRRLHAVCEGLPELRPLDLRIISSEVGYRKPSGHFYRALVEASGRRADEILMVGDDLANDVIGAKRAGLDAVELTRRATCDPGHERIGDLRDLLKRTTFRPVAGPRSPAAGA